MLNFPFRGWWACFIPAPDLIFLFPFSMFLFFFIRKSQALKANPDFLKACAFWRSLQRNHPVQFCFCWHSIYQSNFFIMGCVSFFVFSPVTRDVLAIAFFLLLTIRCKKRLHGYIKKLLFGKPRLFYGEYAGYEGE